MFMFTFYNVHDLKMKITYVADIPKTKRSLGLWISCLLGSSQGL